MSYLKAVLEISGLQLMLYNSVVRKAFKVSTSSYIKYELWGNHMALTNATLGFLYQLNTLKYSQFLVHST